jgi:hypothetical protein
MKPRQTVGPAILAIATMIVVTLATGQPVTGQSAPTYSVPPAPSIAATIPAPTYGPLPLWTPSPTATPTATSAPAVDTLDAARAWTEARIGKRQSDCLWQIANVESGLDPNVWNSEGSGAYGLWQALPASKIDAWTHAGSPSWADTHADLDPRGPMAQAGWALDYTASRYGTACNAWATWQQRGSW